MTPRHIRVELKDLDPAGQLIHPTSQNGVARRNVNANTDAGYMIQEDTGSDLGLDEVPRNNRGLEDRKDSELDSDEGLLVNDKVRFLYK